ncbi:hypothetical protein H9P43_006231 [Blastocladiella emersonii ATCC 22665]|nr:hypothetical protein H9P43_006231 [Blastocladiella emersonii ATCC 22665]
MDPPHSPASPSAVSPPPLPSASSEEEEFLAIGDLSVSFEESFESSIATFLTGEGPVDVDDDSPRFDDGSFFGRALRNPFSPPHCEPKTFPTAAVVSLDLDQVTEPEVSLISAPEAASAANAAIPSESLPELFSRVAARFAEVRAVSWAHPSLCQYIDCVRGSFGGSRWIYLVQESHPRTLSSLMLIAKQSHGARHGIRDLARVQRWARQLVAGLAHLQSSGIQHRNLSLNNLQLDDDDNLKLFNFGIHHITEGGLDLATPVTAYNVQAPEVLLAGTPHFPSYKADIWAVGLLLFQLYTGEHFLLQHPKDYFSQLAAFIRDPGVVSDMLDQRIHVEDERGRLWRDFLGVCLTVDSCARPTAIKLAQHPFLATTPDAAASPPTSGLGSTDHQTNLHVLFHLWLLSGGNLDAEFAKATGLGKRPPVLSLPSVLHARAPSKSMPPHHHFPFPVDFARVRDALPATAAATAALLESMATQPESVRARNVGYQFLRIQLFSDLLLQYPLTADDLVRESRGDIPAFLRPHIWAALLGIDGDVHWLFQQLEAQADARTALAASAGSATAADGAEAAAAAAAAAAAEEYAVQERQLDADAVRCHSYHPMVASPTGRAALKRLIRAWLAAHPDKVYWQGFDSVCAVFLTLFPSPRDLPVAYACLDAFVARYLARFLGTDNAVPLHEFWSLLTLALRFTDPELAAHLDRIGVTFDLFAMSWVLTLFAHVLALPTTYRVWDHLLTRTKQHAFRYLLMTDVLASPAVRPGLIAANSFDEALHLLSEFPHVDFAGVLTAAVAAADAIPPATDHAFDFDADKVPAILPFDMADYPALRGDVRTLDVRFKPGTRPTGSHLPRSTFVAVADLSALETLLKQQRTNKRITVVHTPTATDAATTLDTLVQWGVPGACWLESAGDDPDVTCACAPAQANLGGGVVIYKCSAP